MPHFCQYCSKDFIGQKALLNHEIVHKMKDSSSLAKKLKKKFEDSLKEESINSMKENPLENDLKEDSSKNDSIKVDDLKKATFKDDSLEDSLNDIREIKELLQKNIDEINNNGDKM